MNEENQIECSGCEGTGIIFFPARQAYGPNGSTFIEDEREIECSLCHGTGKVCE